VSVYVSVNDSSRYLFRETKDCIYAVLFMCKLPSFDTFQVRGSYVFRCGLLNRTEENLCFIK